jgi:hypothetical protein
MAEPFVLPYHAARSQLESDQCNAFATVAAMETWVLAHAPDLAPRLPLSERDLWYVTPPRRDDLRRVLKAAAQYGIVEEGALPERRRMPPRSRVNRPELFWRPRMRMIYTSPQETPRMMVEALKAGFPLITSIYIDGGFERYDGRAPYSRRPGPSDRPPHAICIVGYDAAARVWIAKNSLGPQWGMENGCFTLRFGDSALGAEHMLWAVDSVVPPAFKQPS